MVSIRAFWAQHGELVVRIGWRLLLVVGVLVLCKVVAWVVRRGIRGACERLERLDVTLVPVLCSVASVVVYAVGAVVVLDFLGMNANSLVAIIGAAGLAVGLALKDTLSHLASGIMLLILRPFRAGDVIECAGRVGTVEAVTLFTVVMRTGDGLFVSLPNSSVWGAEIVNYTRNGRRRLTLTVGIGYGDDVERGLSVLRQVAAAEPRLLAEPAPEAVVSALGESAVVLALRAWTRPEDFFAVTFALTQRVKAAIEAAGLSIPFPQREVTLRQPAGKLE